MSVKIRQGSSTVPFLDCSKCTSAPRCSRQRRLRLACRADTERKQGESEPEGEAKFSVQDPSSTVVWGGRLPSRRRAITGSLSGLGIVLVSNLGGVTGALLGFDGGNLAGRLRLDVLYPVKGLKRCIDAQNGFEFQYPARWLADQRMVRRNAERLESTRGLDPPSAKEQKRRVAEPIAAFGPAGSTGELNISIIVAPISKDFTLTSLGGPEQAGQRFLENTIATPNSGVQGEFIAASQRKDSSGQLYYSMEYRVERPGGFKRHNLSAYAVKSGFLYTLNAQSPEVKWREVEADIRRSIASLKVTTSGPPPQQKSGPY